MTPVSQPIIIYVPGLLPKPEPEQHRTALLRCLLAGVRRVDTAVADAIAATPSSFDVISWTYDFYGMHADFGDERAAIDAVIASPEATGKDIAEASSWSRRLSRWVYTLGDMLPFLIPHFAPERAEVHLRDLRRYQRNEGDSAERARSLLKAPLIAAAGEEHPVMLIGHSMGSIIAYDALWQLSHEYADPVRIDLLLTLGSPLGQRLIQKKINGHADVGRWRYPTIVRTWKNIFAVGDLTAIDPWFANDFEEMTDMDLVEDIEDNEVWNSYRLNGELNVHSEYGYLVNEKTAQIVVDWWRNHSSILKD